MEQLRRRGPLVGPVTAGLCFGAYTWVISCAIWICALVAPRRARYLWLVRTWARWTLRTAGITVVIERDPAAALPSAGIFMANHQSVLDLVVLALLLPDRTRFVAKAALARIPVFGWAMRASGLCLFIDRADRRAAIATLNEAGALAANGDWIVVFPEGTRQRGPHLGDSGP
jgi:1-acyl-sn-glycerol-3-phosphate acyltransferase